MAGRLREAASTVAWFVVIATILVLAVPLLFLDWLLFPEDDPAESYRHRNL